MQIFTLHMLINAATPRQKGPRRTSPQLLASTAQSCSDHPLPSYFLPMQVSEWTRGNKRISKVGWGFQSLAWDQVLNWVFRRGTGLYRKTRTRSHCSPEEISQRNAFILVHNPSQVKQHSHMFLKETVLSLSTNLFKSTNTLLLGPKAKW